ncbi:signal peptidase II [Wansuia hejianensis]|uniref:Lipoprotein signal peptidase n=1 Tax=Wansuia hejianensis TaxID=2763667 RepID=A0A926ILS0_9FIRM|nr:signal peptidase II [Wansuia hejianensis]MBC8590444.1 signal peptidase II [Wansuia hejianensis]
MIFLLTIGIIILDQISKLAAIKYLKNKGSYIIIENFFEFSYVENRGAAFGILQQKRMFFIIITITVIVLLSFYLLKYYHELNKYSTIAFAILIGGAIGNFIDRVRLGYVVDFISFKLMNSYNFPVFNIADIAIVISTFIIIILVLTDKIEA